MPTTRSIAKDDDLLREVLRIGVRRFVVRFATHHRVHDLPAETSAKAALRETFHDALAGILGIPQLAYTGRKKNEGRKGQAGSKRRARRKRRTNRQVFKSPRELERLEQLKRFVAGVGSDPDSGGPNP